MAEKSYERIEGMDEMRRNFGQLKSEMHTRIARRMVVAGGKVLKEEAAAIAWANGSVRTGSMIENIAIKREKTPEGIAQYHLGVRHGRSRTRSTKGAGKRVVSVRGRVRVQYVNDPFYWRWVERGRRVTPRSVDDGTTTFTQRLRNGKIATRTRRFKGNSLRARRRAASAARVGAKPFISAALVRKREAALQAMQRSGQLALKKYGIKS